MWDLCCLKEVGVASVWLVVIVGLGYYRGGLVGVVFVLYNGGRCEVGVAQIDP